MAAEQGPNSEQLHEEFKRRIKAQRMLESAETTCMRLWARLASRQMTLGLVDGWKTLPREITPLTWLEP